MISGSIIPSNLIHFAIAWIWLMALSLAYLAYLEIRDVG